MTVAGQNGLVCCKHLSRSKPTKTHKGRTRFCYSSHSWQVLPKHNIECRCPNRGIHISSGARKVNAALGIAKLMNIAINTTKNMFKIVPMQQESSPSHRKACDLMSHSAEPSC